MPSLKTVIIKQIKLAVIDIRSSEGDKLEGAVHSFRRRCKRIRAYLRLLPPALFKRSKPARRYIRFAAASLSQLRDAQVMKQTLRKIHERRMKGFSNLSPLEDASPLEEFTENPQEQTKRSQTDSVSAQHQLQSARKLLNKAKRIVVRLPSSHDESALLINLQKTYKAARIATQLAVCRSEPEDFHELRKVTKQFYYQCKFLGSVFHCDLQGHIDRAGSLADKLGDALDLCVLQSNLANAAVKPGQPMDAEAIEESQQQMKTLFDESALLACRLFFESPKKFGQRIV